jgi:hypothetical protein
MPYPASEIHSWHIENRKDVGEMFPSKVTAQAAHARVESMRREADRFRLAAEAGGREPGRSDERRQRRLGAAADRLGSLPGSLFDRSEPDRTPGPDQASRGRTHVDRAAVGSEEVYPAEPAARATARR